MPPLTEASVLWVSYLPGPGSCLSAASNPPVSAVNIGRVQVCVGTYFMSMSTQSLSSDGCEPPRGCSGLNSGPVEEQSALLTAEPTLSPATFSF